MSGYLDDENLIEVWENDTNVMFLSDADMYAPVSCGSMFNGCSALTTLDLSNFDTSNVTSMESMFYGSTMTSLNITNFDTSSVENFSEMFKDCNTLVTIYGGDWNTSSLDDDGSMFTNCVSLVGGNGTHYNSSHTDATYARIDRAGTPGYFTQA
jgi:surface protein